ncbi:MAG: SGNH/GDSL hydrolase family protein [Leifsonia sp.]
MGRDDMPDRHHPLAAAFMRCWLVYQQATNNQTTPRPRDSTTVSAPGANADRVLIFGSGPAVGWGVLTHELALPGALARALTHKTGRGTEIELVADMRITVRNAATILGSIDSSRFDAIVIVLGANDAVRMIPLSIWHDRLVAVLDHLGQKSARPSRTFVTGMPPIESVPGFKTRVGTIVAAHAAQMNTVTAELCTSSAETKYVPLPAVGPTNDLGIRNGQTYRLWADTIADIVAPQLDIVRLRTETRPRAV